VANIGICLLGNYDLERATREALVALEKLVNALAQRHHIQRSQVFGHDHWKPTECPGTHLNAWLKAYKKRAARPRKAQ
jgi:hypothetical protein